MDVYDCTYFPNVIENGKSFQVYQVKLSYVEKNLLKTLNQVFSVFKFLIENLELIFDSKHLKTTVSGQSQFLYGYDGN